MLDEPMSTVAYSIWTSILSWFTPTVFFVFLNLTIGTIYFTSTLRQEPQRPKQEPDNDNETNPNLVRSPSVLQRLKSVNFYSYRSPEPVHAYENNDLLFSFQHQIPQNQQLDRSPSVLQKLKSINLYSYFSPEKTHHETHNIQQEEDETEKVEEFEGLKEEITQGEGPTLDDVFNQLNRDNHHVTRTKSDTMPASGEVPKKLPRKMKKSASVKSAFKHFKEDDIVESRRPATVREGSKDKVTDCDEDSEDDEVDAKADDFINKFKQQLKLQKIDSIIRYKEMVNRGNAK